MLFRLYGIFFMLITLTLTGCTGEEPAPAERTTPKVIRKIPKRPDPKSGKDKIAVPANINEEKKDEPVKAEEKIEVAAMQEKPVHPAAQKEPTPKPRTGYYIVGKKENLLRVARKVYKDPLKWPILVQLNRQAFGDAEISARYPEKPLPAGTQLRYTLTEKEKKRAEASRNLRWVINLISSPLPEKVNPAALALIREHVPVYISRVKVKGEEWMRLRIGFFKTRDEAVLAGKKYRKLLGMEDSWPARIGDQERSEYADYLRF
jgi:hypothetical protein